MGVKLRFVYGSNLSEASSAKRRARSQLQTAFCDTKHKPLSQKDFYAKRNSVSSG
jgi:hypothetical protein